MEAITGLDWNVKQVWARKDMNDRTMMTVTAVLCNPWLLNMTTVVFITVTGAIQ